MAPERSLLHSVTDAIHAAEGQSSLRIRVCAAAADAGYRDPKFAVATGSRTPEEPPAANTEDPFEGDAPDTVTVETDANGDDRVLVPVTYDSERYGTLALGVADAPAEAERERLETVGNAVGHGIASMRQSRERERVEGALRTERRQVEKLHSVAARMVSCESESSIYELAIDAAENILQFDICGIDIAEDEFLVPKATSTSMNPENFERTADDSGVAGETFQESRTIIVDDVRSYENAKPTNPDYRSVLSVPVGDLGVFQAGSVELAAFSEDDAELAELLMAHVAETLKRLRSDAALRESEQKYRTLIEQSHDAVTILRDAAYEFVNQRACELYGREREELLDAATWELIHEDDHETVERVDEELLAELGRHRTFEARIRRPDGEVRYCEFSTTSITYEDDTALLSSIRDITERKEHERELERQNERLEEFASVVSHDLRSPINVVRGSVDLARETGDDEHFERADAALDRMETLVEDILDLARQGKLVDDTEQVELGEAVADAWNTVDAPDATLDASFDTAVVSADPMRLRELLENLFRNSVEHGSTNPASQARQDAVEHSSTSPRSAPPREDAGGQPASAEPSVADAPEDAVEHGSTSPRSQAHEDAAGTSSSEPSVATAPEDARSTVTVTVDLLPDGFRVADDGPGIPDNELERVFERGFTTSENGTGFGLAIVEDIAEAHGWAIEAVPAESGACFDVTGCRRVE
ncbi:PAS domain S-box protein [Halobacterium zhouii]|uniref:PAS domain S-box protein n=1 Tax=Halobacterium zhouii TaxID=2902624 RepID=UPI001E40831B|nr:PAS domain S-box protein [Halobacterium zhouii]